MICTNCKRKTSAIGGYCVACGKPLSETGIEECRSGTSTAVGPAFFVGQSMEIPWTRGSHETAAVLQRLGWVGVAAAALFAVVALEWQTWRPSTPMPTAAVADVRTSVPSGGHGEAPVSSSSVTSIPSAAESRVTITPAVTTPPAAPEPSLLAATMHGPPIASNVRSAQNETADEEAVDDSGKVKLLRAAMGRGDADAPVTLANLYLEGKEVSRSCDQAVSLLESAAAKANARARNRLAAMYEIGTCVQRDRVQAYRWLSAALDADRNNSWAQRNRDQTWREMTSQERTMAEAYR